MKILVLGLRPIVACKNWVVVNGATRRNGILVNRLELPVTEDKVRKLRRIVNRVLKVVMERFLAIAILLLDRVVTIARR